MKIINFKKGFTLVELLVVIAIIGVLASVVLVSLNSARSKARDARRISDLHQISLALENYYDANNAYPAATSALETGGQMTKVPVDPKDGTAYGFNSANCTPVNQKYVLKATLENDHNALDSDVDGVQCVNITCDASNPTTERDYCISP